ncbi:TetR/AcrR family transcriptional regulator [Paenibacillus sp. CAA11]|nr:TetR/AcrR family transcriptional regulator [Paenibacillus sp. CAA11]
MKQISEKDIKTRILLSAKKLFAKQGFDATTVRQICEDAGANVALVSYHFGGKEKVFEAIFEQFFPGNAMDQYADELMEPITGIRFLVREIIIFTSNDRELSDMVQRELTLESPRSSIVLKFIDPVWEQVRFLLEQGKREGKFHYESLNHTLLMVIGVCLAHKRIHNFDRLFTEEGYDEERIPEQAIEFILKALGVKEYE